MDYAREFSGWKKGRFTSNRVVKAKKKQSNDFKQKWEKLKEKKRQDEEAGSTSGNITSTMRRVVDLAQLAKDLWCFKCKKSVSLRGFETEDQHGLAFDMRVRCQNCHTLIKVLTDKPSTATKSLTFDVNKKLAMGLIDSGSGPDPLNNLLSALNVPPVSKGLIKRHEAYIAPAFEKAASMSCMRGILEEKRLALEKSSSTSSSTCDNSVSSASTDVITVVSNIENEAPCASSTPTSNTTPISKIGLTASFDAGWQKRGTQRNYNSLSGHASLLGCESGKVLAYGVACSRCRLCERGHNPNDHKCFKNHHGSAKSMEPALAVRMITQNQQLLEAQCVVSTLVGDEDSSTIHAVRRESEVPVAKWADINHVEKSFTTALYNLKVSEAVRNYLRACFGAVLHTNKDNPTGLKNDLINITSHSYGDHTNCGPWCRHHLDPAGYKHAGLPGGKDLTCLELKASLAKLLQRFANNAEKIAPLGSSQGNENFNQLVSTKHPKNRSYAGSLGLPVRLQASVCHKNDGRMYIGDVADLAQVSPGNETKKYRARLDQRRKGRAETQKTVETKRKRLFNKKNKAKRCATQEQAEGISYETECGFDGIAELVDDPSVACRLPLDDGAVPVYFDLETTGLSKNTCEIIQLAAKCGDAIFNAYILPKKGINKAASSVTGITTTGGELFKNGETLTTTPPRKAFVDFIEFLKAAGDRVVLLAHNGNRGRNYIPKPSKRSQV